MFWTDEDVTPAVQSATELFGPVGSILEGKNVSRNVTIATKEFGKIWYGDIEGNDEYIKNLCGVLSQKVGQTAYILTEDWIFINS